MNRPPPGELNPGAVAGAIAGSIGGLFAVGLPPAIAARSFGLLFAAPLFALLGWLFSLSIGWGLGGLFGNAVRGKLKNPATELVIGAIGGIIPVVAIMFLSWWFLVARF